VRWTKSASKRAHGKRFAKSKAPWGAAAAHGLRRLAAAVWAPRSSVSPRKGRAVSAYRGRPPHATAWLCHARRFTPWEGVELGRARCIWWGRAKLPSFWGERVWVGGSPGALLLFESASKRAHCKRFAKSKAPWGAAAAHGLRRLAAALGGRRGGSRPFHGMLSARVEAGALGARAGEAPLRAGKQ